MQRSVAVVGAGMAGLSAAFRLQEGGLKVAVFEAGAGVGGRTTTVEKQGYLIDTGAILLSSGYVRTRKLIAVAQAGHLLISNKPVLAVVRDGRAHELDLNKPLSSFLQSGFLSAQAKRRLVRVLPDLLRYWRRCSFRSMADIAALDGESSHDYAMRLLGPEVHDYLIDPLIRVNMFTGTRDSPAADVVWLLRIFSQPTVVVPLGGMQAPARAIAARLNVTVDREVRSVERTAAGCLLNFCDGTAKAFDAAVLAVPPPNALAIAPWIAGHRRRFFEGAAAVKSVAVSVGLRRPPASKAMMIMVPSRENPGMLGVVLQHNKSADRAPPGKGLVTFHMAGEWAAALEGQDDDAVARAALLAAPFLEIAEPEIEMADVKRWAYVDYRRYRGCYSLLGEMMAEMPDPAVQFAGEYISAGVEGAVISGENAADAVLARASS